MKLTDISSPGIMISQISPHSREMEGATLSVVEQVIDHGWFNSIQTVDVKTSSERKQIAEYVQKKNMNYTYCLARIQNEKKLNLSSLDEKQRQQSVDQIKMGLHDAIEAGANKVQLVSGAKPPDNNQRANSLKSLSQSLFEISKYNLKLGKLSLMIEPLDIEAHKKHSLGTSDEAALICEEIKSRGEEVYLCLDTAHMLLNGEDPTVSLRKCMPYVLEFHFSNCVTDRNHQHFGDYHLPFGSPGILDLKKVSELLQDCRKMGFLRQQDKPVLMYEVMNYSGEGTAKLINDTKSFFEQAWEMIDTKS